MKRALVALSLIIFVSPVFAGQGSSTSPGQTYLDDGNRLLESDDNAGAEAKFRSAIAADSALVEAYAKLGAVLFAQKKYKDAVDALKKCPDQNDLGVREQLGINYDKLGNPDSVKILEGVVKDKPESYAAQLALGQHYMRTKEYKKAVPSFEAFLKSRPPALSALDAEIHTKLGGAYLATAAWDDAQREYEGLLKTKPNELAYKLGLGTAYVAKEECSKAITLYERILGEASKQPSIYLNLGKCYLLEKRFSDAEREANLYTKAKATEARGFLLLGDALFEQGKYPPALGAYQQAARLDATNGAIIAKIGRTDVKLKNYDAAIAELEQAEAKDPNSVDVLCGEIEAYAAKKNKEKLNQKADKLAPLAKDAKALKCTAQAYIANGNDEKAKTTLERSLDLDAKNQEAKTELVKVDNRLAGHAFEAGQLPKAQQLLVDAEKLQPDSPQTNRNLGIVYLSAKKCIEADQALQKVVKKLPNDVPANRLVARAYLCGGKRKEAIATYEKAASLGLRTRGIELAYVWTELGPLYIEDGKFDMGVTLLEGAVKEAGPSPLAATANHNLYWAYFQRGVDKLKDPRQADAALEDIGRTAQAPKGTLTPKEAATFACYEATAALKAKKTKQAEDAVARAKAAGGCTLKGEYAKLGLAYIENLAGYFDSTDVAKRESAARYFGANAARAPTLADSLRTLARSALELSGFDYWEKSDEKRAEAALRNASKVQSKADRHELDNNLAAIDLFYGRIPMAEKVFQAVSAKVPEALVNLGIIKDRQGDGKAALDYYRRAQDRGVKSAKLKEWIDVKVRLWGGSS
jgi:tetratricopeptide (TPR) repeat protein